MALLRDQLEDGLLIMIFRQLGAETRESIDVAQFAVEAYGRVGMWKEADALTRKLRQVYQQSSDRSAKEKIKKWREIIESR